MDQERLRPKKSEVLRLLADNSKARNILNWNPTGDLPLWIEKYKQELEAQIQGRSHLYEKVGRQIRRKQTNMDDREREINRSLIEKIKHDVPELMSPVVSPVKKNEETVGCSIY